MSNEVINPMEREGCWLCDGCGEVETHKASDDMPVTVGCPVCIQNDLTWKLQASRLKHDARASLAEDRRKFIVNGVYAGQISLPDEIDTAAHKTYSECNLEPEYATAAHDARIKAAALEPLRKKFQRDADEAKEDGDVTDQLYWLRTVMHIEIMQKEYRQQAEVET